MIFALYLFLSRDIAYRACRLKLYGQLRVPPSTMIPLRCRYVVECCSFRLDSCVYALVIPSFPPDDPLFHVDELLDLLALHHAIVQILTLHVTVAHTTFEWTESELGLDLPIDLVLRRVPFRRGEANYSRTRAAGGGMRTSRV